MTKLTHIVPVLLLLTCAVCVSEARADTVVVTGGSAVITAAGGPVTLIANGLTLNATLSHGLFNTTFQPGQTASLRSFHAGLDLGGGPATINGVNYAHIFYEGQMEFLGSIPSLDGPLGHFTLEVPFTFSATLQGCLTSSLVNPQCAPGDLVFSTTTLTGHGTALVELFGGESGTGRFFDISRVTYNFADPVPEPATLVLLSTGLAGAAAAARRRRQKVGR